MPVPSACCARSPNATLRRVVLPTQRGGAYRRGLLYSRRVGRTEIVLAVVRCGAQICVARRSQAVATGRGLWSVVTGYIEPGIEPEQQAWTELLEELALCPPAVRLIRRLDAVPLESPSSGKQFLVHPFLFECEPSPEVRINWEHDDLQWVDPSRLEAPDCVSWQWALVRALLQPQGTSRTASASGNR